MAEAWNTIQKVYVDRGSVKPKLMTYGAISGMVDALGDTGHSRFLTPEMVKQERNSAKGEIEGIGAEVQTKNSQLVIVAPIDGSPAQQAKLKPGDIILKVDGKEVSGLPLDQAVELDFRPGRTTVKLTILDPRTTDQGGHHYPCTHHPSNRHMETATGYDSGPFAHRDLQQGRRQETSGNTLHHSKREDDRSYPGLKK